MKDFKTEYCASHIEMALLFFAALKLTYTSKARGDFSNNSRKNPSYYRIIFSGYNTCVPSLMLE